MGMDVPRKNAARNRWIRRVLVIVVLGTAIPLITAAIWRLKPAAPGVERGTVMLDAVKRGEMLRQVRGLGTLVPEDILWIPAINDGRVERIALRPGALVKPDTVLLVLSNPELELQMLDAEYQLKTAEAVLTDLRVRLESQRLTQEANVARVGSDALQAQMRADRDKQLGELGLKPDLDVRLSAVTAEELGKRHKSEQRVLDISTDSIQAQMASQQVQVAKAGALYGLKKNQVEALKVQAGTEGVLQELALQVGQRVTPGTTLAKVVQPWRLKAELKIPETQAKDILIGQVASIDTRNGIIPGKVSRIDPAATQGTVTVDVRLEGTLPSGARPDLNVDGTIELERMLDVMYTGRPVFGQAQSLVGLFKLEADGRHASRVQVRLGRSSVNTIEIMEGLKVGDQVILSDMSAWDAHDRIRLQ